MQEMLSSVYQISVLNLAARPAIPTAFLAVTKYPLIKAWSDT